MTVAIHVEAICMDKGDLSSRETLTNISKSSFYYLSPFKYLYRFLYHSPKWPSPSFAVAPLKVMNLQEKGV